VAPTELYVLNSYPYIKPPVTDAKQRPGFPTSDIKHQRVSAFSSFLIFASDFLGRFLILILSLAGGLFRDDLNVLVPVLSKLVKSAHGRRPVQAV
jgi:hypothetical protein